MAIALEEQERLRALGVKLRYEYLTAKQELVVCNGCGPKSGLVPVPDFMFEASCNRHDFSYLLGHTEHDRKIADYGFYLALCRDANRHGVPRRWWLRAIAYSFYLAVRTFGGAFFRHGAHYLTWDELDQLVIAKRAEKAKRKVSGQETVPGVD